jgi:tetratricopeptide (TPR) repeat protein
MSSGPEMALRKAEENALMVLRDDPDNTEMRLQLGYIQKDLAYAYRDQGFRALSEQALERMQYSFGRVLEQHPNDPSAHNGMGNLYAIRGDHDSAIKEYEKATKLAPEYTYSWYDFALSLHEKCKRNGPSDTESLMKLISVIKMVFELQQKPEVVPKLPQSALQAVINIVSWLQSEMKRLNE